MTSSSGGYAEHLRRLREQYSLAPAETSSSAASITAAPVQRSSLDEGYLHLRPREALTYRGSPPRTFHDERSELLRLVSGSGKTLPSVATSASAAPLHVIAAGGSSTSTLPIDPAAMGQQRMQEILREVETLSFTITELHKERAAADAEWGARIRSHREHMEAKDRAMLSLEDQCARLDRTNKDLQDQLQSAAREVAMAKRDAELSRQSSTAQLALERRLDQCQVDAEERERLIEAQERCMKDLEQRLEVATGHSTEWERRLLALQRQRETEMEAHRSAILAQSDTLRGVAGVALSLAREAEEGCAQLRTAFHDSRPLVDEISSNDVERLSAELNTLVLHSSVPVNSVEPRTSHESSASSLSHATLQSVQSLVQRLVRSWASQVQDSIHTVSTQRSQSARAASDSERLEKQLRRAEAAAAKWEEEATLIRDENRRFAVEMERNRAELRDVKGTLHRVLEEAELREQSRGTFEVDLHRSRLRVNELEANVTRLQGQKALLEEEAKTNAAQFQQTIAQKDLLIQRLRQEHRSSNNNSAALFVPSSNASTVDPSESEEGDSDPVRRPPITATRSGARRSSSEVGGSMVSNTYLKEQNQQLAAHISFLQRRLERLGPSDNTMTSQLSN